MPQIRDYLQALTLESADAFPFDRVGVGTMFIEANALVPSNLAYVMNGFYEGAAPPGSNQLLGGWVIPFQITLPQNNATALAQGWGLHVESGGLPTSTFVITIALNDVAVAKISINTDGTWSYTSNTGLIWIANNQDRITAIAPSITDATLNKLFWTMTGTLS